METSGKELIFEENLPIVDLDKLFEIQILDIKKASNYLGISTKTLYSLVQENAIPYKRVGRKIRFFLPQLVEWVKQGE